MRASGGHVHLILGVFALAGAGLFGAGTWMLHSHAPAHQKFASQQDNWDAHPLVHYDAKYTSNCAKHMEELGITSHDTKRSTAEKWMKARKTSDDWDYCMTPLVRHLPFDARTDPMCEDWLSILYETCPRLRTNWNGVTFTDCFWFNKKELLAQPLFSKNHDYCGSLMDEFQPENTDRLEKYKMLNWAPHPSNLAPCNAYIAKAFDACHKKNRGVQNLWNFFECYKEAHGEEMRYTWSWCVTPHVDDVSWTELFGKLETEQYHHFTPAQMEKLKKNFEEMDTSKNGFFTLEEKTAYAKSKNLHWTPEQLKLDFYDQDVDKNGRISLLDFLVTTWRRFTVEFTRKYDPNHTGYVDSYRITLFEKANPSLVSETSDLLIMAAANKDRVALANWIEYAVSKYPFNL